MKTLKIIILAGFFSLMVTAGCEKENIEPIKPSTAQGIIAVKMTDAPAKYASLQVNIEAIEIFNQRDGWITLSAAPRVIDVLKLTNGANVALTRQTEIKPGHYTSLKIIFGELNRIGVNDNVTFATNGPLMSGLIYTGSKEVLVEIDEEIKPRVYTEIMLDFQAAQSVVEFRGRYHLKPVITVVGKDRTGIMGDIESPQYLGITGVVFLVNANMDTLSTYTNAEGKFLFQGIESGVYEVSIYPAIFNPGVVYPERKIIRHISISNGQIINLGKILIDTGTPK